VHDPSGTDHTRWDVFAPHGTWQGAVMLPLGFTPSEVDDDFVLGTFTDAMGLSYVQRYQIVKP